MRKSLAVAALLGALSAPAAADILQIDGFVANANTSTLTLVNQAPPGNQPQNQPCLICGTNQPQQPAGFGFNNYKQTGNPNETSFSEFSTSQVNTQLAQDQLGLPYGRLFLLAFLATLQGNTNNFAIGIDVNTATGQGAEVLERFAVLDVANHVILADYNPAVGTPLFEPNNGSGFPDFFLTGFDINRFDLQGDTQIMFYARWSNTSDGAESFFLVPLAAEVPGPVAGAGIPGLIAACGGLIALARNRRRKQELGVA